MVDCEGRYRGDLVSMRKCPFTKKPCQENCGDKACDKADEVLWWSTITDAEREDLGVVHRRNVWAWYCYMEVL